MPTIRFAKNIQPVELESGDLLMPRLLSAGLPVASSCLGDGICGKCRVQVLSGGENLSPVESLEGLTRDRLRIPSGVRLSCQARVTGDIVIDTSYW